jgi:hypothetical protein
MWIWRDRYKAHSRFGRDVGLWFHPDYSAHELDDAQFPWKPSMSTSWPPRWSKPGTWAYFESPAFQRAATSAMDELIEAGLLAIGKSSLVGPDTPE